MSSSKSIITTNNLRQTNFNFDRWRRSCTTIAVTKNTLTTQRWCIVQCTICTINLIQQVFHYCSHYFNLQTFNGQNNVKNMFSKIYFSLWIKNGDNNQYFVYLLRRLSIFIEFISHIRRHKNLPKIFTCFQSSQ